MKIEIDAGEVWALSFLFMPKMLKYRREIRVLLAVINDELMTHMEYNFRSKKKTSHSLVKFYENCRTSSDLPCSLFALDKNHENIVDLASSSEKGVNIYYFVKSSEYRVRNEPKCLTASVQVMSSHEWRLAKQRGEWREQSNAGKSLRELLAQCKPINAHLAEDNYRDDSVMFNYVPIPGYYHPNMNSYQGVDLDLDLDLDTDSDTDIDID